VVHAAPNALAVAALAADPSRRFDRAPEPAYVRAPDVTLAKATSAGIASAKVP
jgi:hypothetical protein